MLKFFRSKYQALGMALVALMVASPALAAGTGGGGTFAFTGNELDGNETALYGLLVVAAAVTVAIVAIRLLRKGSGQVR